MSEEVFQELLARAVTDDAFRQQVCGGPVPAWEALGIAQADGERLRAIPGDRLALFARAILTNRYGRIAESLPMTTRLLGGRAAALFEKFCRSHPPENKIHLEGLAFAAFLDERLRATAAPEPWYLPDVLGYEAHLLDLRFHFDGDYDAGASGGLGVLPDTATDLHRLIPRRLRHHRLLEFGCNIEELLERLESDAPPADVEHQESYLLAHVEPSGACGRLVLSPPLVGLYLAVDGEATIADLPRRVAMWLSSPQLATQTDFRAACLDGLTELASRRIVAIEQV